jgi:hypothetical protein
MATIVTNAACTAGDTMAASAVRRPESRASLGSVSLLDSRALVGLGQAGAFVLAHAPGIAARMTDAMSYVMVAWEAE